MSRGTHSPTHYQKVAKLVKEYLLENEVKSYHSNYSLGAYKCISLRHNKKFKSSVFSTIRAPLNKIDE